MNEFEGFKITHLASDHVVVPIRKSKGDRILCAKLSAVNRTNRVHFTSSGKAILPNKIIL